MVTLDNFGKFLAFGIRPPTSSSGDVTLVRDTGVNGTVKLIGNSSNSVWCDTVGGTPVDQVQVGQSATPVTRQDFNIGSAFPSAPESNKTTSISAGYNSGLGKIEISTVITPTTGSGNIVEVVRFMRILDTTTGTLQNYAMFRDVISAVSFIAGQTINISHEVLI